MKSRYSLTLASLVTLTFLASSANGQQADFSGYGNPGMAAYGQQAIPPGYAVAAIPVTADGSYISPAAYLGGGEHASGGECERCCRRGTDCCCPANGGYLHKWHFYGEFLYLRPRDSEVAFGVAIDGPIVGPPANFPVQIGRVAINDFDYQPGWKGGFQYNTSECSSFSAQYTMYEATTNDAITITGADVIRSLVSHPGTQSSTQNFRQATGFSSLSYDKVDIDFNNLLWYDCDYRVGYLVGLGLVQSEQQLRADFFRGTGSETVRTDVDFYGAGLRFGFDGERQFGAQTRLYAKATGSLNAGEFRTTYNQGNTYDNEIVATSWRAGRIVGIWDLEVGMGWTSRCNNYRLNAGYVFSAWTNTVQTDEWIKAVQGNNFVDMDDTQTFDGLVGRFEARF